MSILANESGNFCNSLYDIFRAVCILNADFNKTI